MENFHFLFEFLKSSVQKHTKESQAAIPEIYDLFKILDFAENCCITRCYNANVPSYFARHSIQLSATTHSSFLFSGKLN